MKPLSKSSDQTPESTFPGGGRPAEVDGTTPSAVKERLRNRVPRLPAERQPQPTMSTRKEKTMPADAAYKKASVDPSDKKLSDTALNVDLKAFSHVPNEKLCLKILNQGEGNHLQMLGKIANGSPKHMDVINGVLLKSCIDGKHEMVALIKHHVPEAEIGIKIGYYIDIIRNGFYAARKDDEVNKDKINKVKSAAKSYVDSIDSLPKHLQEMVLNPEAIFKTTSADEYLASQVLVLSSMFKAGKRPTMAEIEKLALLAKETGNESFSELAKVDEKYVRIELMKIAAEKNDAHTSLWEYEQTSLKFDHNKTLYQLADLQGGEFIRQVVDFVSDKSASQVWLQDLARECASSGKTAYLLEIRKLTDRALFSGGLGSAIGELEEASQNKELEAHWLTVIKLMLKDKVNCSRLNKLKLEEIASKVNDSELTSLLQETRVGT